ncbi:MAG: hypothetical protein ACRC8S_14645 [Fimbriiglobus sp.]
MIRNSTKLGVGLFFAAVVLLATGVLLWSRLQVDPSAARIAYARELRSLPPDQLATIHVDDVRSRLGKPSTSKLTEQHYEWFLGKEKSGASLMFDYDLYLTIDCDETGHLQSVTISNRA